MSAVPRMAFSGVWPTLLVSRRLPGYEQPNEGLKSHIVEQEARETDFTARYLHQSFFSSTHPPVRWLKDRIDETVTGFLAHAGVNRPLSWRLFGWYNVNRFGDHHAPHTHPWTYLSGTYYVQVPPVPGQVDDPSAQPAHISFYDPRTAANMVTATGDPDSRSAHAVLPTAGTLLMWPAPVQHSVHPNLSDELRISISFNVVMDPVTYRPV